MSAAKPSERETALHAARVMLAEAKARRATNPHFADVLLQWAANARRRAAEAGKPKAGQLSLFGEGRRP